MPGEGTATLQHGGQMAPKGWTERSRIKNWHFPNIVSLFHFEEYIRK